MLTRLVGQELEQLHQRARAGRGCACAAPGSGRTTVRPRRTTACSSGRSMLPPERTTATRRPATSRDVAAEQRRRADRARALDDELVALQEQRDGLDDLLVGDRDHVVDVRRWTIGNVSSPGRLTAMPSAMVSRARRRPRSARAARESHERPRSPPPGRRRSARSGRSAAQRDARCRPGARRRRTARPRRRRRAPARRARGRSCPGPRSRARRRTAETKVAPVARGVLARRGLARRRRSRPRSSMRAP